VFRVGRCSGPTVEAPVTRIGLAMTGTGHCTLPHSVTMQVLNHFVMTVTAFERQACE
jgi:hypothetical protein